MYFFPSLTFRGSNYSHQEIMPARIGLFNYHCQPGPGLSFDHRQGEVSQCGLTVPPSFRLRQLTFGSMHSKFRKISMEVCIIDISCLFPVGFRNKRDLFYQMNRLHQLSYPKHVRHSCIGMTIFLHFSPLLATSILTCSAA